MKTNLDSIYKTSENLEKNGVWFDLTETTGFLVRPFKGSNPRVKAAMANYYKPYARQIEAGTLEIKKQQEINIKLFMDACLVEWRGVEIDGKEVAFTKETGLQLFQSLPELFDTLWKYANDYTSYKEDVGN